MFLWVCQYNGSFGEPEDAGVNSIDNTGENYILGIVVLDIAVDARGVYGEANHAERKSPFEADVSNYRASKNTNQNLEAEYDRVGGIHVIRVC
jgi:hypothetical protein